MNTKTTSMKHALSFAALALLGGGEQAQSAGDITVSIGATSIRPQVVSSDEKGNPISLMTLFYILFNLFLMYVHIYKGMCVQYVTICGSSYTIHD